MEKGGELLVVRKGHVGDPCSISYSIFFLILIVFLFSFIHGGFALVSFVSAAGYEASERVGTVTEKPERTVGETGEVQRTGKDGSQHCYWRFTADLNIAV